MCLLKNIIPNKKYLIMNIKNKKKNLILRNFLFIEIKLLK